MPPTYKLHGNDAVQDLSDVRALTMEERARIQTFPAGYFDVDVTKAAKEQMIGNAVPVELARFVATALFQHAAKVMQGLQEVAPPETAEVVADPPETAPQPEQAPEVLVIPPEAVPAPEPISLPEPEAEELPDPVPATDPPAPPMEAVVPPVLDRKTAAVWSRVVDLADLMQVSGRERDAMLAKCAEAFNEAFEEMSPRRAA
jgi:outer membrane biosynthesis protein TonB